ncbi:MAG: Rrf2 family transcriptional regulator [Myxococcota bacterium]
MELVLPTATEYALRAMACLAAAEPAVWVPSRDLVAQTHVPAAYLSKVLRRLVTAGLLEATRGHHGGFRLARPPSEVRFADVLRAMDDTEGPQRCQFGFAACSKTDPCPLHPFFVDLDRRMRAWAEEATLADVDCASYLAAPPDRALAPPRIR